MNLSRRIVNKLYRLHIGYGDRPVFFNIQETYPALLNIEKNSETIRQEILNILPDKEDIPQYHVLDTNQGYISGSDSKNWRVFLLYAMGTKPKQNRALCPETAALLDKVPNLFQAMFSILEPGKKVPAHNGGYAGMLRYHLGLVIPKENPPTLRVKDIMHTWKEGEGILFDDTWEHEVYNESEDIRVVLMIDVLRPMPLFLHTINYLYSYVVFYFKYGRLVTKKIDKLRSRPKIK